MSQGMSTIRCGNDYLFHKEVYRTEGIDLLNMSDKLLVLDFGCFCKDLLTDNLHFDFRLGSHNCNNKKLNHRYPNKAFATLSKKYKNKMISKLGYTVVISKSELDENGVFRDTLFVELGNRDNYSVMMFPLLIDFSDHKLLPVYKDAWINCQIAFLYFRSYAEDLNVPDFEIGTFKPVFNGGSFNFEIKQKNHELSFKPIDDNISDIGHKHVICQQTIEAFATDLNNSVAIVW